MAQKYLQQTQTTLPIQIDNHVLSPIFSGKEHVILLISEIE